MVAAVLAVTCLSSAFPVRGGAGLDGSTAGTGPDGIELVSFDSCRDVLDGFRAAASRWVGPYGFGGGAERRATDSAGAGRAGGPAVAPDAPVRAQADEQLAAGHSTTNTQEAGVDEPDLVKTDGRRIVTVADGVLRVVDTASRRLTGSLPIEGGRASSLLLSGDRVLVIVSGPAALAKRVPTGVEPAPPRDVAIRSRLMLVDIAGAPTVLSTLAIDGDYVDARQVGGIVRSVVRSVPRIGFVRPTKDRPSSAATLQNREILEKSTVDEWLPRFRLESGGGASEGTLVDCGRVRHAASYSGTAMLTVLTIDMAGQLGTGDPITIAADGDTVYGTDTSLYVADDHRSHAMPLGASAPARSLSPMPPAGRTQIHRFDITGGKPPTYVGSTQVEGTLLNQYSLSEHAGHLRVATTVGTPAPGRAGGGSQAVVTVLSAGAGGMVPTGRLDGLGVGEQIYAVRFLGPVGYVVTFRQTDPLYALDLSDPAAPRRTGELKITGYSAYLHPVGDDRLIGVGQEATEQGRRLGTQVSLFDVGDAASPRRIAQYQVTGGNSEVEFDPHAFLYWPATGLLVIPVTTPVGIADRPNERGATPAGPTSGALVLRVEQGRITELGRVQHPAAAGGAAAVRRAMVVGDELWTVSQAGAMINDIDRAAHRGWLPFG